MARKLMESSHRQLEHFFSDIKFRSRLFAQFKARSDIYLAANFNVLDYINPNENTLSDVMRDLLDPIGRHGQGAAFLKQFVLLVGDTALGSGDSAIRANVLQLLPEIDSAQVTREQRTGHIVNEDRHIDLRINFPDKHGRAHFCVAIENKPWAIDQDAQVMDYAEQLKLEFGKHFILVYLAGMGDAPTAHSIDPTQKSGLAREGQYLEMNYREHLYEWLNACYRDCKAEKIRWFLLDLMSYIVRNFDTPEGR